jgi:hypothetical protein
MIRTLISDSLAAMSKARSSESSMPLVIAFIDAGAFNVRRATGPR